MNVLKAGLLFVCVMLTGVGTVRAQQTSQVRSVPLGIQAFEVPGDTLRVVMSIGTEKERLPSALKAFQFEWSLSTNLVYTGVNPVHGLASVPGWTVAANPDKGRVGGFSSSVNAMPDGGVFLVLDFLINADDIPAEFCVRDVRFNSGDPVAEPESLCRVIPL